MEKINGKERGDEKATTKQYKCIMAIARNCGLTRKEVEELANKTANKQINELSKEEASKLIEKLEEIEFVKYKFAIREIWREIARIKEKLGF